MLNVAAEERPGAGRKDTKTSGVAASWEKGAAFCRVISGGWRRTTLLEFGGIVTAGLPAVPTLKVQKWVLVGKQFWV